MLRAYTGASAIEQARVAQPDVIILDTLLDHDGLDVCRQLRRDPHIASRIPILLVSPESPTRQRRLEALRSGAWDQLEQPLDAEEFLLRIEALARAKLDADRVHEEGLVDQATGLYNMRGLARCARELGAQAARRHAALACVVFAPDFGPRDRDAISEDELATAVQRLAGAFQAAGRLSDAIGRLGPTEFAVVAIDTDAVGSVKLAERLAQVVASAPVQETALSFELRAGYYSVRDFHASPVDAQVTILRATVALRLACAEPHQGWLRQFAKGAV